MSVTENESGISMTPENKLTILQRAREILSDRNRWTTCKLRRITGSGPKYCLLGALEQAAYDTGLAEPVHPFELYEDDQSSIEALGYRLGPDISIEDFARKERGMAATSVNDVDGYEATITLLDNYIEVVKEEDADLS